MNNDLISRSALVDIFSNTLFFDEDSKCKALDLINNAPTALFPLTVQIIDKVTDEDIENIKQLMKAYNPQVLNLEAERLPGELAEKLKDRIEESACKYCQMNENCDLCVISRIFQIITLAAEEQRGGAE